MAYSLIFLNSLTPLTVVFFGTYGRLDKLTHNMYVSPYCKPDSYAARGQLKLLLWSSMRNVKTMTSTSRII
jgi:hypothetical protein